MANSGVRDLRVRGPKVRDPGTGHQKGGTKQKGKFYTIEMFDFVVPKDYRHDTCLTDLFERNIGRLRCDDPVVSDENYARVSCVLRPGQKLTAEILGIVDDQPEVTDHQCIEHLKTKKALFVGAQGLGVVWEAFSDRFPNLWVLSFDKPDRLWKCQMEKLRLPAIGRFDSMSHRINPVFFEHPRTPKLHAVLCVTRACVTRRQPSR